MSLIIIIISLALERYADAGKYLNRFNWFKLYLTWLQNVFKKSGLWSGIPAVIITLIPVLIAVAIVYYLLAWMLWGLIGLILSIIIVVYCLGPKDMLADVQHYLHASERQDANASDYVKDYVDTEPTDNNFNRQLTESMFDNFNRGIFAVLFWFVILGPLGAVLYRMISQTEYYANRKDGEFARLSQGAKWCLDILDWIPLRILGLGYALTGHFVDTFNYWLQHVISGLSKNIEFYKTIPLKAIYAKKDESIEFSENKAALELIYRTIVLFLVVLALIIIGMLL